MTSTFLGLRFTDARGRQQVVYAMMRNSGMWDVRGIVGGCQFSKACDGWEAVERTVLWLRRHAHEQPAPSARPFASVAAAILVLVLGASAAALAQTPDAASPAVGAFTGATREYALLHRRLEDTLPRLEVTSNPETIERAVRQLSAALRAERPKARVGDFFTDALAVELRARIADALAENSFRPDDVLGAEAAEGIDAFMAPLHVNAPFPWRYATGMLPCVLNVLPPLPPELQYRIVGNTLVLIDVHADVIVDLLPYALANTER